VADDTWFPVALPILEEVARIEPGDLESQDLAGRLGLPAGKVEVEIARLLEGGFITGIDTTGYGGGVSMIQTRLGVSGARAVQAWPSADPYEALLQVIEQKLLDDDIDPDTRSKLTRLKSTFTEVGKGTVTALLAAFIQGGVSQLR
jgi:hypothetical protein